MKNRSNRRAHRGFTLVELLVVISIIVVLAALSFGAAQVAIKKSNTLKAKTDATAIATAVEQYYQEYSKLPTLGGSSDEMLTQGEAGIELLQYPSRKGRRHWNYAELPKIPFLSVGVGKTKKKGGLVYSNRGAGGQIDRAFDPWGNRFLRSSWTSIMKTRFSTRWYQGNVVRNKKVIVYSYGAVRTEKFGGVDDVKTW